jgi:hypothetical protein
MTLDETKMLARTIAGMSQEQDTIKQNLSPDESEAQLITGFTYNVITQGTLVANAYLYATDSFIIDHPVYGELDSPVLKLDGGYEPNYLMVPFEMPISFESIPQLLYQTTF